MPCCRPISISVTQADVDYADDVARREGISRSDVYRRGLRALRRARHDYAGPLSAMLLVAQAVRQGIMGRDEVALRIERLVREMDAMRRDAG